MASAGTDTLHCRPARRTTTNAPLVDPTRDKFERVALRRKRDRQGDPALRVVRMKVDDCDLSRSDLFADVRDHVLEESRSLPLCTRRVLGGGLQEEVRSVAQQVLTLRVSEHRL